MNTTFLITSKHIYMEDGCYSGSLLIQDGVIQKFFKSDEQLPHGIEHIMAEDKMVLPAIIDVHSHGYHTWSAKTIDKEEIKGLSAMLPSIGVCATLATTTAWRTEEDTMLEAISDAIEEGCSGATILGIHMEGPFYNPNRHNATPRHEVIPPTLQKVEQYWRKARGHLAYMTIAPEVQGAIPVISWLHEKGIVVGAGHSDATSEELQTGIDAGVQVSIHTGNAMRQMDRREVGAMGEALLNPHVYCEVICDFYHIAPEMLNIMFRIKQDLSKFIMISDSDILSGVEAASYFAFGKQVHVHPDGRILLDDGTISGSSKNVLYGIANLVKKLHMPLQEVVPMFSLNPATLLSIQDKKGSLRVGKDADIMILDEHFDVQYTFVEGKQCYKKGDVVKLNDKFATICKRIS